MLKSQHASVSNEVVVPDLMDDELSALCYAAGNVPFALKKKLKDRSVARQLVVLIAIHLGILDQNLYQFFQDLRPDVNLKVLMTSMSTASDWLSK